ncbi:hypothetical protein PHJA_000298900 [Phtheirospermum japonicum]|uniref:Pectin acetylesterase n=1 Tax=Phtheirospermum japonicum TaxID=374723 RepID=A0A830B3Y6_9LAMI|nr:hypothetical protein PHJA_000298900 [Phtheirospermum japonicum]
MFVHSCYRHGHILGGDGWTCSFVVGNNTIGEAISDWYFDRNSFQMIDTQNDVPRNCDISTLSLPEFDRKCL